MSHNVFRFKQFEVIQDKCAMKVGTDGVLLGAWAHAQDSKQILDIGSGSGLITLMLAQRYCHAQITAIECNECCVQESLINFDNSPWSARIKLLEKNFFELEKDTLYNLVVSNPPYYTSQFLSVDEHRNLARQTDEIKLQQWIQKAMSLLEPNGSLCMILPSQFHAWLLEIAKINSWYLDELIFLKGTPIKEAKRMLVKLSAHFQTDTMVKTWVIEEKRHQYAEPIKGMVAPFYL